MKLGYVCTDLDVPLFGREGCSVHMRGLIGALDAIGHDVFVLCAAAGDRGGEGAATMPARVYPLEAPGLGGAVTWLVEEELVVQANHLQYNLRSLLGNAWVHAEGSSIVSHERPDVLYERYSLFGWAGLELARRHGLPLILEVNAPLSREQAECGALTLPETARHLEGEVLRGAEAVVVVSPWLKTWVGSLGVPEARIHVVPNGVTEHLFRPDITGAAVRRRYQLDGTRVVGYVGSFQPWHDVGGLLVAFRRLHQQDARVRLLLVGDGPRRNRLEELARDLGVRGAVVFAGSVAHEQVPEFIAAMDVAVAPYGKNPEFYFSPLKLFEYMAAGRPTVAPALGQIEEAIEHGVTGLLYPAGDGEGLVGALASLLDTPELAAGLGQAARRQALARHTWTGVARRIAELASAVLIARRREGRETA